MTKRKNLTETEYQKRLLKDRIARRKENMSEESYQKKLAHKKADYLKTKMTETEYKKYKRKKSLTNRKSDTKLREEVFAAYGGFRCSCLGCHEYRPQFLQIDHINGNGNKHRKQLNRVGKDFYRWLRMNKFPPGYRVLCANCNSARGSYGRCPHEDEMSNISYTDDGF